MKKPNFLGHLSIVALLVLGAIGLTGGTSEAAPLMGVTPTPTNTPTNTPTSTPTDTPTQPTDTPVPTNPPAPGPEETPTPPTPVGTVTLPLTGQTGPSPLMFLLVAAGLLFVLGIWLGGRRARQP